MSRPSQVAVRCAIYTRKSSEEGLDQDFNSLHAQRDACEAYVRSQAGEGWRALPRAYDDGGYSGGTIERPALQQLLTDIDRGLVDIVVVYKIDRLTRSLMDFAKIVDHLDAKGASFVSVTQSFNTTTSMGRLTLNVLLSFAQFEREVTSERIRDKLAASKKKGLWMGGNLPLGYDADGRTLKVNEAEAEQVRHIFRRYLELKSVHKLARELEAEGYRSKRRMTLAGKGIGGAIMRRGALFHLLSNRVYLGEIPHRSESYPGLHPPVLEADTFNAVQALLTARSFERKIRPRRDPAPLRGKLFDSEGRPMSPTIGYGKTGKRYRYYTSTALQRGQTTSDEGPHRLPADRTEAFLADKLRSALGVALPDEKMLAHLQRAEVRADSVTLVVAVPSEPRAALVTMSKRLHPDDEAWLTDDGRAIRWLVPMRLKLRGGRCWTFVGGRPEPAPKASPNRPLIGALKQAHTVIRDIGFSPLQSADELTGKKAPPDPYLRRLCRLAFLAPNLQRDILFGDQPSLLDLQLLMTAELPLSWADQGRLVERQGRLP